MHITRRGWFGRLGAAVVTAIVAPRVRRAQPARTATADVRSWYRVTYVDALGESLPGTLTVSTPNAALPPGVIERRLYRTNGDGVFRLIAIEPDPRVTTITVTS